MNDSGMFDAILDDMFYCDEQFPFENADTNADKNAEFDIHTEMLLSNFKQEVVPKQAPKHTLDALELLLRPLIEAILKDDNILAPLKEKVSRAAEDYFVKKMDEQYPTTKGVLPLVKKYNKGKYDDLKNATKKNIDTLKRRTDGEMETLTNKIRKQISEMKKMQEKMTDLQRQVNELQSANGGKSNLQKRKIEEEAFQVPSEIMTLLMHPTTCFKKSTKLKFSTGYFCRSEEEEKPVVKTCEKIGFIFERTPVDDKVSCTLPEKWRNDAFVEFICNKRKANKKQKL